MLRRFLIGGIGAAALSAMMGANFDLDAPSAMDAAPVDLFALAEEEIARPFVNHEWTVPNELIVVFESDVALTIEGSRTPGQAEEFPLAATGLAEVDATGAALSVAELRKQFPGANPADAAARGLPDLSGYYVVRFDENAATLDEAMDAYRDTPGVVAVESIGVHTIYATPNDGNYASQWHLNQTSDKDMDAPEAWNVETGDPAVIVAVLDTGVRYYHKDLGGSNASSTNPTASDGNNWINTAEKNGVAGVDDDGNGYVDDWVGYDFVTGATPCWSGEDCSTTDNDPRDFNGHGTHCAGNVSAINNNGYACAAPVGGWNAGTNQPTANGAKSMAMRIGWSGSYLGSEVGYVRMDFAASAFYYAANKGSRIATCSWGSSNSGGIAAAIDYYLNAGGLIFKAAGNDGSQTADYMCGRTDIYCVASTTSSDAKSSFSTYGTWVDISAPGSSIVSLYHNHSDPNNDYVATLSGTSMATPLVAATAAGVWSRNPGWTKTQVWDQVRTTADNIDAQNPSYIGKLGSGRVNLFNAVNTASGCTTNGECDDGDPCNGVETCSGGVCVDGAITDCNNNSIADSCDISSGTSQDCNSNNVPDECEGNPCAEPAVLLMTFTATTALPGVTVENEDIAAYDTGTGLWSLYFDGSDVGLSSFAIDALAVDPANGALLISVDVDGTLTGLLSGPSGESVDDSDIVRFVPTTLGSTTSGTWVFHFDGTDTGLTTSNEDIDALELRSDGSLLISTTGSPGVTGLSSLTDEDLIRFTPTTLGATTAGSWSYYFDGSDVGLSTTSDEDTDAVADTLAGRLLLSTLGAFSVTGVSGDDEDLFEFNPTSTGTTTAGTYLMYFDGSVFGIPTGADVNAVELLE